MTPWPGLTRENWPDPWQLLNHLQTLGHILLDDAGASLEGTEVDDELVCAQAFSSAVEHVEVAVQLGGHVVRVQDGQLRNVKKRGQGQEPKTRPRATAERQEVSGRNK